MTEPTGNRSVKARLWCIFIDRWTVILCLLAVVWVDMNGPYVLCLYGLQPTMELSGGGGG